MNKAELLAKAQKVSVLAVADLGDVFIRRLTYGEWHAFETVLPTDPQKAIVEVVRKSLVDESGNRLFADGDDSINDLTAEAGTAIFNAVAKHFQRSVEEKKSE